MSLAKVVYNISTDPDFAAKWQRDPHAALSDRGLKLSREEVAFLSTGLERGGNVSKVRLAEFKDVYRGWA